MGQVGVRRAAVASLFGLAMLVCAVQARAEDYTDPASLERLIAQEEPGFLLVDVRTPAEYALGHIPTAINIPYGEIAQGMRQVSKSSPIVLYCASGRRAGIAARTLAELGFSNVHNFGAVGRWNGRLVTGPEAE